MANARTCIILFFLLVNYRLVASEPTFGSQIWCSMFCGDDDDSDDDSDDYFSIFDIFDVCSGCSSKPSSSEAATTMKPSQTPVKIMIPPANGLNLTVFSNIGGVLMDLVPWVVSATPAAPAAPAAPAPPAAPAAAPAVTTAAGNTAATTAAPTTAKA